MTRQTERQLGAQAQRIAQPSMSQGNRDGQEPHVPAVRTSIGACTWTDHWKLAE